MIIPYIVNQHAEEAAFLWMMRDAAISQHRYDLNDLAALDDRVEAHLDGLRIAGQEGAEFYQEPGDSGEFFTAAVMAVEMGKSDFLEMLLAAATADVTLSRAVVSAFGWLPWAKVEPYVSPLLEAESLPLRCVGIAASAVHRSDPGLALARAFEANDSKLRARALRAAGELGRSDLLSMTQQFLEDPDAEVRLSANWSSALFGHSAAIEGLENFVGKPQVTRALNLALRLMDLDRAGQWVKKLAAEVDGLRVAIWAAGVVGDSAQIPFLLEMMKVTEHARLAGESFFQITGCNIEKEGLSGAAPEGFSAGPTDEAEDENVAMDPDEDLPWPDPALIAAWWDKQQTGMRPGTRLFLGKAVRRDHLQQVLRSGFQQQRKAAALELACLDRGKSFFEVRAPGIRQKGLLGLI